jgi:hypothetical protein
MDMFVYGCPRVIRYLSLLNHTAVLYDMKGILNELGVTQKELREICIISGTDYNNLNDYDNNSPTLYTTLKYFKKYHKEKANMNFYEWLLENTDYIKEYNLLLKIYDMFDLSKNHYNIQLFKDIKILNGPIMKNELNDILKTDGFIFPLKT